MRKRDWLQVIFQNRKTIYDLLKEGLSTWRKARRRQQIQPEIVPVIETNLTD
jgi:hypothetical protein